MTTKIYTAKYGEIENVINIEIELTSMDLSRFFADGELTQKITNENGQLVEVICIKRHRA